MDLFLYQPGDFPDGDWRERAGRVDELVAEASACLEAGDPAGATAALTEALGWNPASSRVWYLLAKKCHLENDAANRQSALETAIPLSNDPQLREQWLEELNDLTGRRHDRCDRCRELGTFLEFYKVRKGELLCPRCQARSTRKMAASNFLWQNVTLLALILAGPVALLFWQGPIYYLMTNLILLLLGINFFTLVHELAHAATALALGGKVSALQLGFGPLVATRVVSGTRITLNRYFLGGLTYLNFFQPNFIRVRYFLAIAAGPLVHVAFILGFWPGLQLARFDTALAWREAFFLANVILLLSAFFTNQVIRNLSGTASDVPKLVAILTGKLSGPALHEGAFITTTILCLREKDRAGALAATEQGLAFNAKSLPMRINRAILLGGAGQADQALSELEVLHEEMTGAAGLGGSMNHVLVGNGLAYYLACPYLRGADPERSYALALDNNRKAPWISSMVGTLGSSLVGLGYPRLGLMYLAQSTGKSLAAMEPVPAENQAWVALAWHRTGHPGKARRALNALDQSQVPKLLMDWVRHETAG